MGSGSATLPAKRPMSSSSTEIQATEPTNPNPKSQPKRSKKKHPASDIPIPVPAGHASFRLLCHSSRIGGVIGKSGSVINALRIATASKIHVDTAPAAEVCDRVVTVVAPAGAAARVSLRSQFGGGEFMAEVTKAQEALLRVFDRILEVAAESGAVGAGGFGVVSCRMLTDAAGASAVIGKGGKIVERIKKETGTKIRVLRDDLPSCASSTDEMIEIEGDILAVKRALVSVSHCLQACSLGNKAKSTGSFEAIPAQTSPDFHSDHYSQRNFVSPNYTISSTNLPIGSMNYPGSSVGYTSGLYQLPLEAERVPSRGAKAQSLEVSFKILCSNDKIGGVIGKGGSIVRILQNESGASVSVGSSVAECDDRVITISASEDPELRYSPAQKAVVMVFSKSEQESKSSSITARLVVPSNQVGCILGKGGVIISEIRKLTGASIRIIGPGDQVPKCLSANDEVVQISGDFSNVQDALYNLTGRLRENLLTNSASSAATTRSLQYMLPETSPYGNMNGSSSVADTDPYGRIREPDSLAYDNSEPVIYHINGSPYVDVTNSLRRHENSNGLGPSYTLDWPTSPERYAYERPPSPRQYAYDRPPSPRQYAYERPPSPRQWTSQMISGAGSMGIPETGRGLTSLRGGLELGSGNNSAIVTNTTVEIIVPEHVIGSVYGENGNNLTRLRQISGARVIVHEPRPGTSDRVIVISGTPDETQAAQSLLHAFILTGTS